MLGSGCKFWGPKYLMGYRADKSSSMRFRDVESGGGRRLMICVEYIPHCATVYAANPVVDVDAHRSPPTFNAMRFSRVIGYSCRV